MIHQITDRERELAAENERLLAANLDCIAWFDALKTDYDKLREAARMGLEALEKTAFLNDPRRIDATTALKEALGEME